MPHRPSSSAGWSLKGIPSQLPLGEAARPLNLSSSLSQDMHFSCFLVKRASFSFYSSYEMTRMISLILDYRKRRAFLTQSLSLLRVSCSPIWISFYYCFRQYFQYSGRPTLLYTLPRSYLILVNISVCSVFNFSSRREMLFSFKTLLRSVTTLNFSYSFRQLKESRSSRVSTLAHSFTTQGFNSFSLSFMPSLLFSLFYRTSRRTLPFPNDLTCSLSSRSCTQNPRILSLHFSRRAQLTLPIPPIPIGAPLYRSLLPLLLVDQSMRTLPRLYSDDEGPCASYDCMGVLRLDSSLFRFPPENDDCQEWQILVMLLGDEESAFWWERPREGARDDLISFLTRSSICLKISTSFLACMRYAFSLRISIFSIL